MYQVRAYLSVVFLCGLSLVLKGQGIASKFPFIDTTSSVLQYNSSLVANQLYQKWQNRYSGFALVEYGSEEVISVQKNHLPWYQKMGISPGIFFPSSFLGSNHPSVFPNTHSGNWIYATAAETYPLIKPGVCGYSARTEDIKQASIRVTIPLELKKTSDRLRVYCERSEQSFDLLISTSKGTKKQVVVYQNKSDQLLSFVEIPLTSGLEWIEIQFVKNNSKQKWFTLHGMSIENSTSPIWHAIGIRGLSLSKAQSIEGIFLQFQKLNPSVFWFDAMVQDFYRNKSSVELQQDLQSYLSSLKRYLPKTDIILTLPQELSKNNEPISEVNLFVNDRRKSLAQGTNNEWIIWDWHRISGGIHSSYYWIDSGLLKSNGFQLTTKGIEIKSKCMAYAIQDFISRIPSKTKLLSAIDSNKILKKPVRDTIRIQPIIHESWKYHVVKYGETAYRISTRYSISPNDLKTWNHLNGYYIYPGQKLKVGKILDVVQPVVIEPSELIDSSKANGSSNDAVIPKQGTTPAKSPIIVNPAFPNLGIDTQTNAAQSNASSNNKDSSEVKQNPTKPSTTPKYHRVKTQETLYSISKQYGVTVDQIKRLNRLGNNNISVGRVLRIW